MQETYTTFKGLQNPLEFMGIRGRFLTYTAAAIGIGILGYFICAIAFSKLVGFLLLLVVVGTGYLYSFINQKKGLHAKKIDKQTYIVKTLFKH